MALSKDYVLVRSTTNVESVYSPVFGSYRCLFHFPEQMNTAPDMIDGQTAIHLSTRPSFRSLEQPENDRQ